MALKIGTNGAENFSRFWKGGKKVIPLIPRKVLPFIRKFSTEMNRSIWILNRIIEFSVQAVSVLSELDAGRFCDETGH